MFLTCWIINFDRSWFYTFSWSFQVPDLAQELSNIEGVLARNDFEAQSVQVSN